MHRARADSPEHWDDLWRSHPPLPRTAKRIDHWYREPFLRYLPRDGVILEAGCGNGNVLRSLVTAGFHMEGLDFASRAIEENRRVDPAGTYVVGDVRALPHADGSLAGYISFGVIEHFDDVTRAGILREAWRALRPGGVAVVCTPAFTALRRLRAALGGFRDDPAGLEFYQYFFTRRDLVEQVEGAGFRVVHVDGYDFYKGVKDTVGGKRLLDALARRGGRVARFVHHPPRWIRLAACHMVMVVAAKPG